MSINVTFAEGEKVKRLQNFVYSADYGQELIIEGLTGLASTIQVDFALADEDESITMVGTVTDDVLTVSVPDDMYNSFDLPLDYVFHAYIYIVDENSGTTVNEVIVPVKNRAERTDTQPTETQQTTITSLIATMNTAVETAQGYAEQSQQDYTALSEEVDALDDQINGTGTLQPTEKSISDFTQKNYYINSNSGVWTAGSNRGYFIDLTDEQSISLTSNASYSTEFAFLSSDEITEGETAAIVGGGLPTAMTVGETVTYDVPSGATVLYIRRLDANGHNIVPSSIIFYSIEYSNNPIVTRVTTLETDVTTIDEKVGDLADLDTTDKTSIVAAINEAAQGVTVDSEMSSSSTNPVQNAVIYSAMANKADASTVDELDSQINGTPVLEPTSMSLSDFTLYNYFISPNTGQWASGTNRGYYVELGECAQVSITGNASYQTQTAFLSNIDFSEGSNAPIVGDTLPTLIEMGTALTVEVPYGATYLYIRRLDGDGHNIEPSAIVFYYYSSSGESIVGQLEELSTLPDTVSALASDVADISEVLPTAISYTRQTINASGTISDSNYNLLSGIASATSGQTITITDSAYRFRSVLYDSNGDFATVTDWVTSTYTLPGDYNVRIHVQNASGGVSEITADDVRGIIETEIQFPFGYIDLSDLANIPSSDELFELQEVVETLEEKAPYHYVLANQTINSSGTITDTNLRLLSDLIYFEYGQTITIESPYKFRIAFYSDEGETISGITDWANTYTMPYSRYGRINVIDYAHQNDALDAEVVSQHITTNTALEKVYYDIASAEELSDYVKYNRYSLNIPLTGKENMIWSWWSYPQVMSFQNVRNKLYWTYTTAEGFSGVASYDFDTQEVKKTHLKQSTSPDDHNNPAVIVLPDGTVVVEYNENHYNNHVFYVRRSTTPECIDNFSDAVKVDVSNYVTYGQFYEYGDTLFLFYRSTTNAWAYITSTDGGETWGSEVVLVKATMQYYVRFVPTTTSGVLRMVMYSNPDAGDVNIRLGFFHCDDLTAYNSDNSTSLGTDTIAHTNFDIVIAAPTDTNVVQRLFDIAVTNVSTTRILYCPFTLDSDNPDTYDAVYKLYDSGTVHTICNGGYALWGQKYQGGASWIGDDGFVVARSDGTYDYIETYTYDGTSATFSEEIYKEAIGSNSIRNGRPVVDVNEKAFLWHRGYYNHSSYTDFNTDAKLHLITN